MNSAPKYPCGVGVDLREQSVERASIWPPPVFVPLQVPVPTVELPDATRGDILELGDWALAPVVWGLKRRTLFEQNNLVALDAEPQPQLVPNPLRHPGLTVRPEALCDLGHLQF